MNQTVKEIQDRISGLDQKILETQEDIQGYAKELASAAKKGKFADVKYNNRRIANAFEEISQLEEYRMDWQQELVKAERNAAGFGLIVDFLEEVFEKDVAWHKLLVEDYKEKGYKHYLELLKKDEITKTVFSLARTSEKEAADIFRHDLNCRYIKIVGQIEKKVGNVLAFNLQRNSNGSLDGKVMGDKGAVYLQTIIAGGYNIQRAHYRTLIKAVDTLKQN